MQNRKETVTICPPVPPTCWSLAACP